MPLTVHRIILTDPPAVDDFASNAAKGRAPRSGDADVLRLWDGLSVYATRAQAQREARGAPYLGSDVAELRIPDGADARFERTRGPGHHTLWADPTAALGWVVAVVPVDRGG